jgi:hypothetical protein
MIDRDERADTLEGLMRALWILLFAACSGTGLDIEIFVPDGAKVDRVELWIAYEHCGDCPNGIAWTQTERASGDILFLRDERLVKAEPTADRWVLHLDADPDYSQPHSIAVIGYDGTKVSAVRVLRDVFIPTSSVQIWRVDLHPATAADTKLDVPPADPSIPHRAHVWAREPTPELPDPTGCLVYQKWTGSMWNTEYFVPKSDPDCDGYAANLECSDFWYQYHPAASTCVTTELEPIGACTLGESLCSDGISSDTTCRVDTKRLTTCMPNAYCDECSGDVPADTCIEGATERAHNAGQLAHYDCQFGVQTTGMPCDGEFVELALPQSQAICTEIAMHTLAQPFSNPRTDVVFASSAAQAKFKAVLRPTAFACIVDIYWEGGHKDAIADGKLFLLEVGYSNMTRTLYPIWVSPTGNLITNCSTVTQPVACMYKGPTDDVFSACALRN